MSIFTFNPSDHQGHSCAKLMILNYAAKLSSQELYLVEKTDLLFDTSGRIIVNMADFLEMHGTNKFAFVTHSPILDYLTSLLRIESLNADEADEKTIELMRSGNAKKMLGL